MKGYVYKLSCPIKCAPIYVGCTMVGLEKRLKEHLSMPSSSELYRYIKKNKPKLSIELLEECDFSERKELEQRELFWIKKFITDGVYLMNKNQNETKSCTSLVKHRPSVRDMVARAVIGTGYTIGSFYDEAAEEKLKSKPTTK